jgi:hypothetical protein
MKKSSHVSLPAGKILKLSKHREVSLKCNEGTAWITNPGDEKDYILREGDILNLSVKSRRAPVVIGCVKGHVSLDVFTL